MKVVICTDVHSLTGFEIVDSPSYNYDRESNSVTIAKSIKENGLLKAGETWSQRLQRENSPSRWITYRGNHLLVRSNKDGTGTVVFSANPAFEHLKIIPKTHEDYKQIKEDIAQRQKERDKDKKNDYTPEELEASKQATKERKLAGGKMRTAYIQRILDVADVQGVDREKLLNKEERKIEKKVDKLLDPTEGSVTDNGSLKDILDKIKKEGGKDKKAKKMAVDTLQDLANNELIDETIKDTLGIKIKNDTIIDTGNKELDSALKKLKLTKEQAMQIKDAKLEYKSKMKAMKELFKDEVIVKSGNVKITNLQGIGIVDFTQPTREADEIIESAIKEEVNRQRAKMNTQFYAHVDGFGKGINKHMSDGASNEVNAFAGMFLDGGYLSRDFVDFIGVKNAARIIANEIQSKGVEGVKGKLEKFMVEKSGELVKGTLKDLEDRFERIQSYKEQKEDGILAGRTGSINIARQYASISKQIGQAAGSLDVSSTILDSLRDDQSEAGDIIVDGGKNLSNLKEKLTQYGMKEGDYFIKRNSENGRYEVIVPHEKFSDMVQHSNVSKERDLVVGAIKSGKTAIPNFRPPGTNSTFYDTKTAAQLGSNKEGWEAFKNKKGVDGYTSHQAEGKTLYRKKMDGFSFTDQQQRLYEFAVHGQRTVWNSGAGTGKTIAMLGTIKALKETGELKNFAVISPPSRLVSEFFKDQEKFYPGMKMVNLDDVKGIAKKKQILDDAAAGKYDIVISGHDSIKSGSGKSTLNKMARAAAYEWIGNAQANGEKVPPYKVVEARMKVELRNKIGLPNLIAEANPGFVGIDEAHEAFKSVGKETDRSGAIKTLSKNAKYFIPMTGTAIRNDVGELASLLSVTRPDIIPDASKWRNKWKNVGSQSTLMRNQMVNQFRKEYDNIMITENIDITDKSGKHLELTEKKNKIKLTPTQKEAYKRSEKMYRLDRDSKGEYGIMKLDNRELAMEGENSLRKFNPNDMEGLPSYIDTNNDGTQDKRVREFLAGKGYDPDKYHLKKLGGTGASARRDSRHDLNLHAGDWKENAKVQNVLTNFIQESNRGNNKQVVFFNRNESLDTLKQAFKEGAGLKDSEIAYLNGSLKGNERKAQVNEFNTNPEIKVMLTSKVGQTGLNMQSGTVNHWLSRNDTFAEQEQGNARTFRRGQTKDVTSYYNDTDTVYDNNKVDVISRKKNLTRTIGDYKPEDSMF